jgi:hypothetical protein
MSTYYLMTLKFFLLFEVMVERIVLVLASVLLEGAKEKKQKQIKLEYILQY